MLLTASKEISGGRNRAEASGSQLPPFPSGFEISLDSQALQHDHCIANPVICNMEIKIVIVSQP